jgi:hypothetical protein
MLGASGRLAEVAEAGVVNPGRDLTLRVTEKCAVRE